MCWYIQIQMILFFFFFFNAEGFSFKSFVEGRLVPNDHPIPGPSQHALGDLH